jgi:phenylalanyl-tRNA synthetase beta chain
VSIGTHDLDRLQGPFSYEALPPKDINFVPLNQTTKMNGEELMNFYEVSRLTIPVSWLQRSNRFVQKDKNLGKYLHIIRDSPVYPVIYDSKKTVCSLPPIINGDHSKITLDTRNVFMEITATDKTKVEVVNHIMVAMFSQYTEEPFTCVDRPRSKSLFNS